MHPFFATHGTVLFEIWPQTDGQVFVAEEPDFSLGHSSCGLWVSVCRTFWSVPGPPGCLRDEDSSKSDNIPAK